MPSRPAVLLPAPQTCANLCKLVHALLSGVLITSTSVAEMATDQTAPETSPAGAAFAAFGLGLDNVADAVFERHGITVCRKGGSTTQFCSYLSFAPIEKMAVAVVCAGNIDPQSVSTAIMQALLETTGRLPHKKAEQILLPPAAREIPDELRRYEGYYASGFNVVKASLDYSERKLKLAVFTGGEFVPRDEYIHCGEGQFYISADCMHFFYETDGRCYLMVQDVKGRRSMVSHERVRVPDEVCDCSSFAGKTWLVCNVERNDLFGMYYTPLKTAVHDELPGLVMCSNAFFGTFYTACGDGSLVPFAEHARDLTRLRIEEGSGGRILTDETGYRCVDLDSVAEYHAEERIVIETARENAVRRVDERTVFRHIAPENGRIFIYAPQGNMMYDTMRDDEKQQMLEPRSSVVFTGDAGTVFV